MLGDQGRAVRVVYQQKGGKPRTLLLSSRDPERLAQAIQRARGTALPEAGLRIEEPTQHAIGGAEAEEQDEAQAAQITNMKR